MRDEDVDGRVKPGHDEGKTQCLGIKTPALALIACGGFNGAKGHS
jgi:hypothetical protein